MNYLLSALVKKLEGEIHTVLSQAFGEVKVRINIAAKPVQQGQDWQAKWGNRHSVAERGSCQELNYDGHWREPCPTMPRLLSDLAY